MPLYFVKPKRWPPSRPVQFILAFLALLIVLALLAIWLFIGYRQSISPNVPDQSDTSLPVSAEPIAGVGNTLLILQQEQQTHFVLLQANPSAAHILVAAVPANLATEDGSTLADTLRKHGSIRAKEEAAAALGMPIRHHITLSAAAAESYFGYLEEGLTLTLPEDVAYVDQNGAHVKLSAGQRTLSPAQMGALLRYTGWQSADHARDAAADLIAAIINRYWRSDCSFKGHFATLSNVAQTDLRIDHFNDYRATLSYLAEHNDGTLCRRVVLSGTTANGFFTVDMAEMQTQTGLQFE